MHLTSSASDKSSSIENESNCCSDSNNASTTDIGGANGDNDTNAKSPSCVAINSTSIVTDASLDCGKESLHWNDGSIDGDSVDWHNKGTNNAAATNGGQEDTEQRVPSSPASDHCASSQTDTGLSLAAQDGANQLNSDIELIEREREQSHEVNAGVASGHNDGNGQTGNHPAPAFGSGDAENDSNNDSYEVSLPDAGIDSQKSTAIATITATTTSNDNVAIEKEGKANEGAVEVEKFAGQHNDTTIPASPEATDISLAREQIVSPGYEKEYARSSESQTNCLESPLNDTATGHMLDEQQPATGIQAVNCDDPSLAIGSYEHDDAYYYHSNWPQSSVFTPDEEPMITGRRRDSSLMCDAFECPRNSQVVAGDYEQFAGIGDIHAAADEATGELSVMDTGNNSSSNNINNHDAAPVYHPSTIWMDGAEQGAYTNQYFAAPQAQCQVDEPNMALTSHQQYPYIEINNNNSNTDNHNTSNHQNPGHVYVDEHVVPNERLEMHQVDEFGAYKVRDKSLPAPRQAVYEEVREVRPSIIQGKAGEQQSVIVNGFEQMDQESGSQLEYNNQTYYANSHYPSGYQDQPMGSNVRKYDQGGQIIEYRPISDSESTSSQQYHHQHYHQQTVYGSTYVDPSTRLYASPNVVSGQYGPQIGDTNQSIGQRYPQKIQVATGFLEHDEISGKTYHVLEHNNDGGSNTNCHYSASQENGYQDQLYFDPTKRGHNVPIVSEHYDPTAEISMCLMDADEASTSLDEDTVSLSSVTTGNLGSGGNCSRYTGLDRGPSQSSRRAVLDKLRAFLQNRMRIRAAMKGNQKPALSVGRTSGVSTRQSRIVDQRAKRMEAESSGDVVAIEAEQNCSIATRSQAPGSVCSISPSSSSLSCLPDENHDENSGETGAGQNKINRNNATLSLPMVQPTRGQQATRGDSDYSSTGAMRPEPLETVSTNQRQETSKANSALENRQLRSRTIVLSTRNGANMEPDNARHSNKCNFDELELDQGIQTRNTKRRRQSSQQVSPNCSTNSASCLVITSSAIEGEA